MTGFRELAAATPAHRDRQIDLLRAVAIGAVVLGHWLLIAVERGDDGQLAGFSALAALPWAHPITWLFQVMPIFFMVGGYANAASLTAYRRRDGGGTGWLLDRSARLVGPTTVLLVAVALVALASRLAGAPPDQVAMAAWLATLPLWFLVAYLGMIALTPVMHAAHRRAGLVVPLLLLVPVAVADAGRFWSGSEQLGWGSFLFGWLAIHQIGFAWYDGRLPAGRRAAGLLLGGVAALLLLTVAGPYPVSMVSVPGAPMQNSSPPTLALMALAATQLGVALLLRGTTRRWLRRGRVWLVVVAVNAVILTVFLWHMSAAVLGALALDRLGWLATPPVGSGAWLRWRVPWVLLLAVVLAGLVAVGGRVETRAAAARTPPRARAGTVVGIATGAGYAMVLAGLLWVAVADDRPHGPFALPTGALAVFLTGALLLRLSRAWLSRGWLRSGRLNRQTSPDSRPGASV